MPNAGTTGLGMHTELIQCLVKLTQAFDVSGMEHKVDFSVQ